MSNPTPLNEAAAAYVTPADATARPEPWSHQWHDELGLLCHRAIAEKLRRAPALLDVARENLRRWIASEPGATPSRARGEWQELLSSQDLERIISVMTDPGEDGHRRRQSTPFAGILSADERQVIRRSLGEDS